MTANVEWRPLPNDWSYSSEETLSLRVKADGETIVTADYAVYGSPLPNINHHHLPPDIRLCQAHAVEPAPVPVAPAIPEIIGALEFFVENFGSWNGNDSATYHTGFLSKLLAEMQAEK
jgi:hypothetical protein